MICVGRHVATGESIALEFDRTILEVRAADAGSTDTRWLAPGFVDLQVNGFAGVDFNDPETPIDKIGRALDAMFSTGVTRCLPTVITGPPDECSPAFATCGAHKWIASWTCDRGISCGRPHIGAEDGPRGAHPARWVRPPDLEEFARWQDATGNNIRLVTLSPHWPEAAGYISAVTKAGVIVSIGHTGANAEQIARAVDAGATLSTHLGNAAQQDDAEISELPLGSACGRPPERQFHRGWAPSGRVVPESGTAGEDGGKDDSGDGRGGAGRRRTGAVSSGRARRGTHDWTIAWFWPVRINWRGRRCGWIARSRIWCMGGGQPARCDPRRRLRIPRA